ncbi:MAG: type III pantothenate kinase [Erysipelotrichaceae bacterium]|nr:type III pantothenate kinase [Erysipelotrichaceae bacterium]
MLLSVDMGNTNIKLALWENDQQISFTRFDTHHSLFFEELERFFGDQGINQVDDIIVSCVVPSIKGEFFSVLSEYCPHPIIEVDHNFDLGIKVDVPNPARVGHDLISMAAYAYHLSGRSTLICSFGTASVFCYVDHDGNYKYAVIAPGFSSAANALWEKADQLPRIRLHKPESVLADNTADSMNVGIVEGYIGLCRHLVQKIKEELDEEDLPVYVTGGQGRMLAEEIPGVVLYEPDFVTQALHYLYQRRKHLEWN